MSNIDKIRKYGFIYENCMNKIQGLLQDEWLNYNQFLEEANISVLPDNHYRNGKPLDYGKVRRLYSEWENKKKINYELH